MKPSHHVAISLAAGSLFGAATRSWDGALSCLLCGVFIDLDHILDFWFAKRKLVFTYGELWNFCAKEREGKLRLVLHSYEALLLFWAVIVLQGLSLAWWGAAVGLTVHILCDAVTNPLRPFVYFFTYRWKHGFQKRYLFLEDYYGGLS
ncbi:MAG: hypothetical protein Q8Q08_12380 [Candidatus Omnitrophota bacterium]|nr:hypothetical protein [Candidatus Omnitrophota bacterium]MDZ4241314.1 hypothetical protein [Candidatus Omnitrophota bacterium]